jgi:hypothetical protein
MRKSLKSKAKRRSAAPAGKVRYGGKIRRMRARKAQEPALASVRATGARTVDSGDAGARAEELIRKNSELFRRLA